MILSGLILIFAGVTFWQCATLIKQKARRELIVFACLQSCAFALCVLYILGIPLALNHTKIHAFIVEKLLNIKFK